MNPASRPSSDRKAAFHTAVALLLAVALSAGCTSMQTGSLPGTVRDPASKSPIVHVGDEVEIQTRENLTRVFKVTAIDTDTIVGGKVRVKYADIASLRVRRLSKGYTALTVGIVLYTIFVGTVIYALAHVGPGMAGG